MIEVNSLKKIYEVKRREKFFSIKKEKIEAVKNISLRMEKGGIVGLLGINGAGKTTTIKMLTTLIEPTEGTYTFDGIDAIAHPDIVKRQINMIAGGERMIYWKLTAYENLWYYGQLYGIENNLLKKRIEELVKLVGLMAVIPVFLCASLCWGAFMNACFLYSRDSDFLFTVLEEPMEIFAGVKIPVNIFPQWARLISCIFPLTYVLEALRQVTLNAAGIGDMKKVFIISIIIILVLFSATLITIYVVERHMRKTGNFILF